MKVIQPIPFLRPSFCLLTLTALAALSARAGTDTWIGNSSPNLANTNNWSPLTAAGPVANDYLSFIAAGTAGAALTNDFTAGTAFSGLTFQSGASAYTLTGNSLGLAGITNLSGSLETIGNAIALPGNGTLSAGTGGLTLAGPISGAYNLTVLGSGTVTLAGTNSYTGVTAINGGTVSVAAPGALPSGTNIVFTQASSATLNLQGLAQTVGNLIFTNNNILSPSFTITGTNGSSLTVGQTNLLIAPFASGTNLTVNLSGLTAFTYSNTAASFAVANESSVSSAAGGTVTVTLAKATNTLAAAAVSVGGASGGGGTTTASILNLGTVNTFKTANLNVGNSGSRSQGTVQFATGLTNPVLAVTGTSGGSSLAGLTVGAHESFELSDHQVDLFDTTAGTLTAQFGGITIGRESPTGNSTNRGDSMNCTFKMGAGTLFASSLTLGTIGSASNVTNANYSIIALLSLTNHAVATITNVTLANNSLVTFGSLNHLTNSATINLTNGATLTAATIQGGAAASAATITNQVILGGAMLANVAGTGLIVSNTSVILAGTLTDGFNISAGQTGTVYAVVSGTGSLTAGGAGELVLAGANTYTNATYITNGTLQLGAGGSLASTTISLASNTTFDVSLAGGGTFVLNSGQTLTGSGTVNGNLWDSAGAPVIPGGTGTAGTLTINNNLTLNGQALTFDLSPSPASGNDLINVGGNVTLYANTTVNINPLAGLGTLSPGTYTLMNYSTVNTNSYGFVLSGARNETLNVGANSLTLVVASGGGANLTWVGDGVLNTWDVQTTTNWADTNGPEVFYQQDNVTFTDTGSNTPAINLAALLTPGSMTVMATQSYTFSGTGQLAGSMALGKDGPGTLYLQTTNNYSGGTVVTNGVLEVDTATGAGTGPISLGTNVLAVNIAGGTLPNAVTGAGIINVTETASASTTFGGSLSNFTGTVNLPASPGGTAKTAIVGGAVAISSNATVNVAGGGTFYLANATVPATINVSGAGNSETYGALRVDGSTVSGPVNLLGNTTVGAYTGTAGTISGAISDGGHGYGVTLTAPGTVTLAGTNTYTGPTTVTNGTVNVSGNESAATGGWLMAVNLAAVTVNFQAASKVVVAPTNRVQVGLFSPTASGAQTLNVAGTVTNNGELLVSRAGFLNINSGGVWVQGGVLSNTPPTGSGYSSFMAVNSGGSFIYTGTNPIVLAPAYQNGGYGTLVINAGTFTTGQGFTNNIGAAGSTGGGQIVLATNGTLVLSANIPELTSGANTNNIATISLSTGGGSINTAGFSTTITNAIGGTGGLTKLGAGTLTLEPTAGTINYTGVTTVSGGTLLVDGVTGTNTVAVQSGGTLGGTGTVTGAATVLAGGTVLGGDNTYSNTLTFAGGLTLGNSTNALTASSFTVAAGGTVAAGTLKVNGTNIVNILDATLVAGTNTLITYTGGSIGGTNGFGGFQLGTVPAGMAVALLNTGSAVALVVTPGSTVNTNSPVLTNSYDGVNFSLSWPTDHIGWRLLAQTNNLAAGISGNPADWGTVAGSAATNAVTLPVNPALPAEFYRLVYP